MKPTAIDLFAGVGGMSLGFQLAGFDIKGAFELDAKNVESYNENFKGKHAHQVDLAREKGSDLLKLCGISKVDIIFGGPPCQGFSVGGLRKARDPRKQLIRHFGRLVGEIRPRFFVMENVHGLTMSHGRSALKQFLSQMKRAGYKVIFPIKVLNAADYGVPQKRMRVILFGHLPDETAPSYPEKFITPKITVWDAIQDLPEIELAIGQLKDDVYTGEMGVPSKYGAELRAEVSTHSKNASRNKLYKISGCQRTNHAKVITNRFKLIIPGERDPISRFVRLKKLGLCSTIRAGTAPDHGSHTAPRPIHPVHPRCITVREAARLHSYPDWFAFHPTIWHAFRQIGNSVPPALAKAIALCMQQALMKKTSRAGRVKKKT